MARWVRVKVRSTLYRVRYPDASVSVDPTSWVSRKACLRRTGGGEIRIGANCEIHDYAIIDALGGSVIVGDDCSLNPFAVIYGMGGVDIDHGVRIATQVVVASSNHIYDQDLPIRLAGSRPGRIQVQSNVWIGAGARILAGVSIGADSVIGAGAVVAASVPANCLALGVPATAKPINRITSVTSNDRRS